MIFRFLADIILIFHLCFVLFAIFGGLARFALSLCLETSSARARLGISRAVFRLVLSADDFGKLFSNRGGEAGYEGGFIEHYVSAIIYPGFISPNMHVFLAVLLVVFNLLFTFTSFADSTNCLIFVCFKSK